MYGTGFHQDPVAEVPQDVQRLAAGMSLELEQEELKQSRTLTETVQGLTAEYQEKLRAVIGPVNLQRYLEFRVPLRRRVREIVAKAEPTVVGEDDIQKARRQAAEEAREFLKDIDFDMARASQLRGEYHTRVQKAIARAISRPDEPNYLVLPEMVPKNVHNPWATYGPPYPGWAWAYSWGKSDESSYPSFAHHLNSAAGQVGTYSRIRVSGADDSDWAYVRYRTGIRFWYRLPVAGMAEVWMHMQCIDTPYSGHFSDEWGWSDADCDQESHAYLRAVVPGPGAFRQSTILDYRRGGTSASWSRHVSWVGDHRWAHIFSADAYPGGTWLLLEVGTEEWNHFWSNDVTVTSTMTMRWFLENVYVRSTGE